MPAKRTSTNRTATAVKRAPVSKKAARPAPVPRRTPRFGFIRDTITEMKKVTWLSRSELLYLSTLVLIVTVVVGAILGLIDVGFNVLVNQLLLGG